MIDEYRCFRPMDGRTTKPRYCGLADHHISPELLELYVLGRAPESEVDRIEDHLLLCEQCRVLFSDTSLYVAAMQLGLRQLTGMVAVHATKDGVVTLSVKKGRKAWIARVRGPGIDAGRRALSEKNALRACQDAFRSMYPEHTCGPGCKVFVS